MKKSNKLIAGIVTLASVMTLTACQSTNDNTKVISMKGDTISVSDFYNETKHTEVSQKAMLNLVVSRVFEAQYGDKVSNKEVEKAYNKTADQYGASFSAALAQSSLTPETYKKQIRSSKLVEYAVRETAKKELTTEAYKKAYETYTPTMAAQVIALDSEETAKSVLEELKAEGADFAAIAKEKTTAADKKIAYKFDSGATSLPADVVKAASGLKEGDMSEVISVLDPATYQNKFYIVKVTKKAEKKADWKVYKKRLKAIILAEKTRDMNPDTMFFHVLRSRHHFQLAIHCATCSCDISAYSFLSSIPFDQVNVANNGKEALELLDHSYDLILLDIMMPVLNGIETLKQIRKNHSTPVMMLTARGDDIDRILGLELGADDYLPKPFNDRELVARIKAILRRTAQANSAKDPADADKVEFGGIMFYPGRQQAMLGSKDLELTGTEFALLLKLITNPGIILTREELSLEVLGKPLTPFDRAIDMHMSNLRKKLPSRPDDLPWFKTLRGRGYLLIAEK